LALTQRQQVPKKMSRLLPKMKLLQEMYEWVINE
jgi:hypothetical protein